jgi:CheY-like chemotaxis protein
MSERILVIEDNEQNMYMITYLLEQAGMVVTQARDGREGIALACADPHPDIIILDIQLPEIDGYEVARRLRNEPALRDVPVVAVTSFAMEGDRETILAAGCTDYLEKPLDPTRFVSQIRRHLPKRS